jgi:hypothetical protein
MELGDIDWRAGELIVRGKGRRRDRLPLLAEVGGALAEYLRHGRPASQSRRVFLRRCAPFVGLAGTGALCAVLARACERAGIAYARYAAAHARSSTANDPAGGRSHARPPSAHARSRCPPAPRTTGKRPDTAGGSFGATPPAWRNQRVPTAGDTPISRAASSEPAPRPMAAQNRTRSSRQATVGRPGEGICPRYN